MDPWRPVAALARRVGSLPGGAELCCWAHRAAAQGAGWTLAQLDGTEGVYLGGSLTRPEHLVPGVSDIVVSLFSDEDVKAWAGCTVVASERKVRIRKSE